MEDDVVSPVEEFLETMIRNVFWLGLGGVTGYTVTKYIAGK